MALLCRGNRYKTRGPIAIIFAVIFLASSPPVVLLCVSLQYPICSVHTHADIDNCMVTLARDKCTGLNDMSQSEVVGNIIVGRGREA